MSKKMKGLALDSSRYGGGGYEDTRAMFKHQTLMQDFQELQKETEVTKNKLRNMKQRKQTLLAEVRFLRRRYTHLLKNKSSNPPLERELVQPQNLDTRRKGNTKDRRGNKKEANARVRNLPPLFSANQKGKVYMGRETALRSASPVIDLSHKGKLQSEKEAAIRNPTPASDLTNRKKVYKRNEAALRNLMPVIDLNQHERIYGGSDTVVRNPASVFDLTENGNTQSGNRAALPSRAPIFDLNQISTEEEELQNDHEQLRFFEEPKKGAMRVENDEQHNDLMLSVCRSVGDGQSRSGKRKISWQDPVALRV